MNTNIPFLITARLSSERLPRKLMRDLDGTKLVGKVIERGIAAFGADQVVLCTSPLPTDEDLVRVAESHGIAVHLGHPVDILDRLCGALREREAVGFVGQTGENFDWTEFEVYPGDMFCFLEIPYPKAAGPGGVFRIIGFVLPMDEHTTKVFFWRMREVSGLARESWRFLYRAKMEKTHWDVLEQDRVMLEGMPDDARRREMLYQHDLGVSRIRQVLTRAAKAQVEAELKVAAE